MPGTAPQPLFSQDPYLPPMTGGYGAPGSNEPVYTTMTRLLDELRVDYVWMPGNSAKEMGINDMEFTSTFAFPLFYNPETPLLITPGFGLTLFNGPQTNVLEVPSRVFAGYVDSAWNPQVTDWFGAELNLRVGVYSDFDEIRAGSIRYTGKGLAVLRFSPSFTVKGGAWYLDRNRFKLFPAGGFVWTPNNDFRLEAIFPEPKVAWRLPNVGNTEWWFYGRGEYGGGNWTMKQVGGAVEPIDYNDIRVGAGLEFLNPSGRGLDGLFEVGFAFERELRRHDSRIDPYYLNPTVYVRGSLAY